MDTEGNRIYRLVACVLALAVLTTACGGSQQIFAEGDRQQRDANAAFDELQLPEPIPAVPSFVVRSKKALSAGDMKALEKTSGVAIAVPVALSKMKVSTRKSSERLTVASVSPLDFRSVAPAATRSADFVWFALVGGSAVMTPEAADELKLGGDTAVKIAGEGKLAVGALADNATPNFADIVVSDEKLSDLGDANTVVIGAESGVTLNTLAGDIRKKIKVAELTWLLPKSQAVAAQQAAAPTSSSVSVPSVSGLHPALADAVSKLIAASGGRIWIVSGYRDSAHQYRLWMEALEKYGDPDIADNWVAPPGRSNHERGLAVDLGGDLTLAVQLVQELGLPLWRPMSWEPWHFEIAGSRG